MRRFRALFHLAVMTTALAAGLVVLPACKNNGQPSASTTATTAPQAATATVAIDTGERKLVFHVELAITPAEFQRGLMFRTSSRPTPGCCSCRGSRRGTRSG